MSEARTAAESGNVFAQLEDLEQRRQSALAELAAIHRERCEVVAKLNQQMSPTAIAALLGISRQQVHKLLRDLRD